MKFIITRTSDYGDYSSPCAEAKKTGFLITERYSNKKTEIEAWTVDFDSIEDLVNFSKKYGNLMIDNELLPNVEFPGVVMYGDCGSE